MGATGVIVASVASGGFALGGVALGNTLAGRRERRAFRIETALGLADVERAVWAAEEWAELNSVLQRLASRLAVVGIASDAIEALREISVRSWRDNSFSLETHGPEFAGINIELLHAMRSLIHAVEGQLLRRGSRGSQEDGVRAAAEQARAVVIAEPS